MTEVFRIAHMGDLGCELPKEQREMLKDLDVLMIPVGGYYTIDAAQARRLVEYVTAQCGDSHALPWNGLWL